MRFLRYNQVIPCIGNRRYEPSCGNCLYAPFHDDWCIFGFQQPPVRFFAILTGLVIAYLIIVELVKGWFYRKYSSFIVRKTSQTLWGAKKYFCACSFEILSEMPICVGESEYQMSTLTQGCQLFSMSVAWTETFLFNGCQYRRLEGVRHAIPVEEECRRRRDDSGN